MRVAYTLYLYTGIYKKYIIYVYTYICMYMYVKLWKVNAHITKQFHT